MNGPLCPEISDDLQDPDREHWSQDLSIVINDNNGFPLRSSSISKC